jgi:hypothetical protein
MTLGDHGIWWSFEDTFPYVIYTGHSFLATAKFEIFMPSDMMIKGTSVSRTLSLD